MLAGPALAAGPHGGGGVLAGLGGVGRLLVLRHDGDEAGPRHHAARHHHAHHGRRVSGLVRARVLAVPRVAAGYELRVVARHAPRLDRETRHILHLQRAGQLGPPLASCARLLAPLAASLVA